VKALAFVPGCTVVLPGSKNFKKKGREEKGRLELGEVNRGRRSREITPP
jgi:hypothetical protein